jgi:hypothetical protein
MLEANHSESLRQLITTNTDMDAMKKALESIYHQNSKYQSHLSQYKHIKKGKRGTIILMLVVAVVLGGLVQCEISAILSTQGSFFSMEDVAQMNEESPDILPSPPPSSTRRVVLIVMDGLRYDYVQRNDAMRALLEKYEKDSLLYNISVYTPTLSLPQWLTLVTGSGSEIHGWSGNDARSGVLIDSIFNSVSAAGLHAGLTGYDWWATVLKHHIHTFGDGSIGDSKLRSHHSYSDRFNEERLRDDLAAEVLYQSVKSESFHLFMAHFDDIDHQAHLFGVTPEYNRDDTYNKAVSNKAAILAKLVEMLSNDTMLIVTADHGHVDRGGHGGIDPKVYEVPLWIYKKNSLLAEKKTLNNISYPDISCTIAGYLGVRVPRQGWGSFIPAVKHLFPYNLSEHNKDLLSQKQILAKHYLSQLHPDDLPSILSSITTQPITVDDQDDAIANIISIMQYHRHHQWSIETAKRLVMVSSVGCIVVLVMLYLMQKYTMCDIVSITSSVHAEAKMYNLCGLVSCTVGVGLYYVLAVAVLVGVMTSRGHTYFDFIYTEDKLLIYLHWGFWGTIGQYTIITIISKNIYRGLMKFLLGEKYQAIIIDYLYGYYTSLMTVVSITILMMMAATCWSLFGTILEFTPSLTKMRFQTVVILIFSVLLSVGSALRVYGGLTKILAMNYQLEHWGLMWAAKGKTKQS